MLQAPLCMHVVPHVLSDQCCRHSLQTCHAGTSHALPACTMQNTYQAAGHMHAEHYSPQRYTSQSSSCVSSPRDAVQTQTSHSMQFQLSKPAVWLQLALSNSNNSAGESYCTQQQLQHFYCSYHLKLRYLTSFFNNQTNHCQASFSGL